MRTERLTTYLNDHLAGSVAAVELLNHLIERHTALGWAGFLSELRAEIEADQASLRDVLQRLGEEGSAMKNAAAWVGEKLSVARRTFSPGYDARLALLEELETIALGVQGKLGLWRALTIVAPSYPALRGLDLARLEQRARDQHERVETHRLAAASAAFQEEPPSNQPG